MGWKTSFLLKLTRFRGHVSFLGCNREKTWSWKGSDPRNFCSNLIWILDGMFWAKTSILEELNIKTWLCWSFNDLPFVMWICHVAMFIEEKKRLKLCSQTSMIFLCFMCYFNLNFKFSLKQKQNTQNQPPPKKMTICEFSPSIQTISSQLAYSRFPFRTWRFLS